MGDILARHCQYGCECAQDGGEKAMRDPGHYYVNVHTTDYPNGAMRGQLP
jgi:hypothetical protein